MEYLKALEGGLGIGSATVRNWIFQINKVQDCNTLCCGVREYLYTKNSLGSLTYLESSLKFKIKLGWINTLVTVNSNSKLPVFSNPLGLELFVI